MVGGGLSGLAVAHYLKAIAIDKDRKPGGFFKYDDYPVMGVKGRDLVSNFLERVDVKCDTTVFKHDEDVVWITNRGSSRKLSGIIIAANGFREKTLLELGVYGSRPSGIFYLYSAWELTNRGYLIGDKVVIYGFNHYSVALASKLSKICEKVIMVYENTSFIHTEEELLRLGVELVRGKIMEILGKERVSSIRISGRELEADALVLAELSPWNPLQAENVVGNAAMIIEDPRKIIEASKIVAESLLEGGESIEVVSNVPHIPRRVSRKIRHIMLAVREGAELRIDGKKLTVDENYPTIEIPLKERVVIEAL